MKKFIILTFLLFSSTLIFAKYVKFSVNMIGQIVDTSGVHIAGDFQSLAGFGANWTPGTTELAQEIVDTNIYSLVVNIPAFAKYEYKFLYGAESYQVEFVPVESRVNPIINDNRWIYIDSLSTDTLLVGPIQFGHNAPLGKYLLRFKVDMQYFAGITNVHVEGDFQGWDPATTRMYSFDGNIFQFIAYPDTGNLLTEYRFITGNSAANAENVPASCATSLDKRGLHVNMDTVLDTVCFGQCSTCLPGGMSDKNSSSNISVYPNPSFGKFRIISENLQIKNIEIYNVIGAVVFSTQSPFYSWRGAGLEFSINISSQPAGFYFLNIESESGVMISKKIILN